MSRLPSPRPLDTPAGHVPRQQAQLVRGRPALAGAAAVGSDTATAGAMPVSAIVLDTDVPAGTYLLLQIPADVLNLPPSAPLPQQMQAFGQLLQELVNQLTPATPPPPPAP